MPEKSTVEEKSCLVPHFSSFLVKVLNRFIYVSKR